jgi:hypothetical protein
MVTIQKKSSEIFSVSAWKSILCCYDHEHISVANKIDPDYFTSSNRTWSQQLLVIPNLFVQYSRLRIYYLIPRACDPREGTWGSGIIRFREESDWPLIWNAQFGLSQDWLLAMDYPRASRSFPRIAGSGNEIATATSHWLSTHVIGWSDISNASDWLMVP